MYIHLIALQFASGRTFFLGVFLAVAACTFGFHGGRKGLVSTLKIAAVAGGMLVLLSGTPLPLAAYALWFLSLGVCVVASELPRAQRGNAHSLALGALVLASAGMVLAEIPRHTPQPIPFPRDRPVMVIGDSLALALEAGVEPWPSRLAAKSGLKVTSLAAGGKRVGDTARDAERVAASDASALIGIGGNDLLGGVGGREFEHALAALLQTVCTPGRTVAMFELPVIPFRNSYGRIQRRYAALYHVILIPKGCLASILADPVATVDGLHLSGVGHERVASLLASLVDPAAGGQSRPATGSHLRPVSAGASRSGGGV